MALGVLLQLMILPTSLIEVVICQTRIIACIYKPNCMISHAQMLLNLLVIMVSVVQNFVYLNFGCAHCE